MRRAPLAVLLLAALASIPSLVHSAWLPNGSPVCLDPAHQSTTSIVPDGAGGAFVLWLDGRNSPWSQPAWSQETDVYIQRMTASGDPAPGWTLNGVPLCTAPGYQAGSNDVALIADGAGGAIALWKDSRANPGSGDLYAQRITASGAIAAGWPVDGVAVCTAPDWQDGMQLAPDGAGGAFAIWRDQRKGSAYDHDTYAHHLTATGALAPGWPVDGLALDASAVGTEDCTLLEDGAGGAYFAYTRDAAGLGLQYSLILKRLDAAGATVAGWPAAGVVVCNAAGGRVHPRLVTDGAGGVLAVWADTRTDVSGDLYAAHVSAAGVVDPAWPVDGAPVAIAPGYQGPPEIVSDGAGGVLAAWSDYRNGAYQIFAQHLTGTGARYPGWPVAGLLASTAPAGQRLGGIAPDGAGGAYIVYAGGVTVGGVRAQHLTAWGAPAPGWSNAGASLRSLAVGSVDDPRIAPAPGGGAIVSWADDRGPAPVPPFYYPNPYDIYATMIVGDGPVPVLASLVSAELSGLTATVTWQLSGSSVGAATVERRVDGGEWSAVGVASAESDDRWRFEDATLEPGHTYGYRLGYTADGASAFAPEAIVVVPAASLAIGRIAPVRGTDAVELSVTLTGSEPARLELFDLGGRRLATRDLGALGAGAHAVRIEHAGVTSGLLLARVRQGGRSATARAMVVR